MHQTIIKRLPVRYFLALFLLVIPVRGASAEFWNLPQQLSPANCSITFEVDSTWHLVKGKAKDFSGKLWLSDPKNFESVRGSISLPISEFDTDSESRDERMREVMNATQYPNVEFTITAFDASQCDPKLLAEKSPCESTLSGDLSINSVTKKVAIKTSIERNGANYQIAGITSIKWSEFNVEDPSILIAKLYEDVNIHINLSLSTQK